MQSGDRRESAQRRQRSWVGCACCSPGGWSEVGGFARSLAVAVAGRCIENARPSGSKGHNGRSRTKQSNPCRSAGRTSISVILKNDAIDRRLAGQSARFIDEVYNRPRLHAALSYLSPQQFERRTGRRSNQRPDRCPGQGPTPASGSPSSGLRASRGSAGVSDKERHIIDVDMLLRVLMAWPRGEPRVCSMVPIPTEADEEAGVRIGEQEHVTGASGGGPDPSATSQPPPR